MVSGVLCRIRGPTPQRGPRHGAAVATAALLTGLGGKGMLEISTHGLTFMPSWGQGAWHFSMTFLMLWITLGLSLLILLGIEDLVASISIELAEAEDEGLQHPAFHALCLTFMVLAWPMLLLEYVQKRS